MLTCIKLQILPWYFNLVFFFLFFIATRKMSGVYYMAWPLLFVFYTTVQLKKHFFIDCSFWTINNCSFWTINIIQQCNENAFLKDCSFWTTNMNVHFFAYFYKQFYKCKSYSPFHSCQISILNSNVYLNLYQFFFQIFFVVQNGKFIYSHFHSISK